MNRVERFEAIRDLIAKESMVEVSQLSETFDTSEVTIRRDLRFLEEQGVLRRVRGGAVATGTLSGPLSHRLKSQQHPEEKRRIARAAAQLIGRGDRVILDSGSTVLEVARQLRLTGAEGSAELTVITGSLPVIQLLRHRRGLELIVVGGQFLSLYETTAGPQAVQFLQTMRVDKYIMCGDGLTIEHGVTADHPMEAATMRAMAESAGEIVLVADSSKIGHTGFVTVLPLHRVKRLVTDTGAPDSFLAQVRALGIEVLLA